MLNRLLQLRSAVHATCRIEELLRPDTLSDEDWDLLTQLKSILSIFVKATVTGRDLGGTVQKRLNGNN